MLVASLGSAAHAQSLLLGAKYRDSVMVADRKIPLLDGEWTVVAVGSTKSTKGNNMERVYLAQMAGNRLSRWVNISTNEEWFPGGWSHDKEILRPQGRARRLFRHVAQSQRHGMLGP
jgi:hypothetical protein